MNWRVCSETHWTRSLFHPQWHIAWLTHCAIAKRSAQHCHFCGNSWFPSRLWKLAYSTDHVSTLHHWGKLRKWFLLKWLRAGRWFTYQLKFLKLQNVKPQTKFICEYIKKEEVSVPTVGNKLCAHRGNYAGVWGVENFFLVWKKQCCSWSHDTLKPEAKTHFTLKVNLRGKNGVMMNKIRFFYSHHSF